MAEKAYKYRIYPNKQQEEPKQQFRKLKQAFYDSNTNYSSFLS